MGKRKLQLSECLRFGTQQAPPERIITWLAARHGLRRNVVVQDFWLRHGRLCQKLSLNFLPVAGRSHVHMASAFAASYGIFHLAWDLGSWDLAMKRVIRPWCLFLDVLAYQVSSVSFSAVSSYLLQLLSLTLSVSSSLRCV